MPSAKLAMVVALALSAGFPLEALATIIFDISVTSNGLEPGFDTPSVTARAGESINFVLDKGATVMRSTFDAPCTSYTNPRDAELNSPFESNGDRFQQLDLPDTYSGSPLWFTTTSGCKQGVVFAINPSDSETWEAFRARAIQPDSSAATSGDPPQSHPPPTVTASPPVHLPPGLPEAITKPAEGGSEPTTKPAPTTDPRTNPLLIGISTSLPLASHEAPTHQPPTPSQTNPIPTPPRAGEQNPVGSTSDSPETPSNVSSGDQRDGAEGSPRPPAAGDGTSRLDTTSQGRPIATRTIARLPGTTIVEVQYESPGQSNTLHDSGSASRLSKPSIVLALLSTLVSICVR
ncbi:hypothetical protein BKA70DRAFT_1494753 [Coprinopsis sp. MPI-PUGE-AT-0042]|nr:hypothetical protein BKA70DRAFT_1494753 [Coprinopsis sp. MPI-PUGE-AT-0042]